jgi:hypothetical protein
MKSTWKYLCAAALGLALLLPSTGALAGTAANTRINNTATLNFDGGTISSTVSVTVSLVPATPNVVVLGGNNTYTAPDSPTVTDSVIVTATSNGPADYDITVSLAAQSNNGDMGRISTSSSDPDAGTIIAGVSLGASVTTGASTTGALAIPAGQITGSGATLAVNGLQSGDVLKFTFGGTTYTRNIDGAPTDNGDDTYTLTLNAALPSAPPAGMPVHEQRTVLFYAFPGTVAATGTNITTTIEAVVSTAGAAEASATSSPINTWTTPPANVSMTKYVRNHTNAIAGGGATDFTIDGATRTFYTDGVTGNPGETLEYVVFVVNSGAGGLSGSAIGDLIPTEYVDFVHNVYGANEDVWLIDATTVAGGVGIAAPAVAAAGTPATYVAPNLTVNVGAGADYNTAGTIPAGGTALIAYQVTIK